MIDKICSEEINSWKKNLILVLMFFIILTLGFILIPYSVSAENAAPGFEITEKVMMGYMHPEDPDEAHNYNYVTEDVYFKDMATGQPMATNREELIAGLDYFYNVAFDIQEVRNLDILIGNGEAVIEWTIVGNHTGEFAGLPATGKSIEVPMIGRYILQEEYPHHIEEARIYLMINILMDQLLTAEE